MKNLHRGKNKAMSFQVDDERFEFAPKKQLGQNFLVDANVMSKMIEACKFTKDDNVLEIGPGFGVFTRDVAKRVNNVLAIETDLRLYERLVKENSSANLSVIHADFLKFDLGLLPYEKMKVFGNLPYYISSPIIMKILDDKKKFNSFYTTVQLEFGERLVAKPNTKNYSSLSLFVQYHARAKLLFKIKNTCFKPAPKVHSCFLELILYEKPPYPAANEEQLFTIIRQAFSQRRKTLPKVMENLVEREKLVPALDALGINPKSRAEDLTLKNFVDLANFLEAAA